MQHHFSFCCNTNNKEAGYVYIRQLNSKTKLNESSHCHFDPDLRDVTIIREKGWRPAFGQTGSSLTELKDNGFKQGRLTPFLRLV